MIHVLLFSLYSTFLCRKRAPEPWCVKVSSVKLTDFGPKQKRAEEWRGRCNFESPSYVPQKHRTTELQCKNRRINLEISILFLLVVFVPPFTNYVLLYSTLLFKNKHVHLRLVKVMCPII